LILFFINSISHFFVKFFDKQIQEKGRGSERESDTEILEANSSSVVVVVFFFYLAKQQQQHLASFKLAGERKNGFLKRRLGQA
jgi:hypothetical protein